MKGEIALEDVMFVFLLTVYTASSAPLTFSLLWFNTDFETAWEKFETLSRSAVE